MRKGLIDIAIRKVLDAIASETLITRASIALNKVNYLDLCQQVENRIELGKRLYGLDIKQDIGKYLSERVKERLKSRKHVFAETTEDKMLSELQEVLDKKQPEDGVSPRAIDPTRVEKLRKVAELGGKKWSEEHNKFYHIEPAKEERPIVSIPNINTTPVSANKTPLFDRVINFIFGS